jgi:hypothetical protein
VHGIMYGEQMKNNPAITMIVLKWWEERIVKETNKVLFILAKWYERKRTSFVLGLTCDTQMMSLA